VVVHVHVHGTRLTGTFQHTHIHRCYMLIPRFQALLIGPGLATKVAQLSRQLRIGLCGSGRRICWNIALLWWAVTLAKSLRLWDSHTCHFAQQTQFSFFYSQFLRGIGGSGP